MVEKDTMVYKNLGNSGLKVSALSIGNWLNGHNLNVEETQMKVFSKFIDAGVNFLDTAEIYGFGNAETILGKTLKAGGWNRDELVISTKFIRADQGNGVGLSRKRLVQAMRNSLKRLQLDYVDIMFLHRFDHEVPLEETVRAVSHLIDQGKASYWGTSEFTPLQLMEVYKICDRYGYNYPIAEQCQYNMFIRENVEVNYTELFDRYGLGTTIWSPLSGGILSGKYNDGNFPESSRLTDPALPPLAKTRYLARFNEENKPKTIAQLQGLKTIADELGISQSQLSIAWCMKNPDVSTAITGATSVAQAEDSVKAVEALGKLDSSVLLRIEEILGNRPTPHTDYRTYRPLPPRR
jgi:voltage-dependent potassium channel beta subunit